MVEVGDAWLYEGISAMRLELELIVIVCLSAVNVGQEVAAFDVTSLSEDPWKVRLLGSL